MINFPPTPALGQEFTSGGKTWRWDGQKWVFVVAPPPSRVFTRVNHFRNGNMSLWQRNPTRAAFPIAAATSPNYTFDRWAVVHNGNITANFVGGIFAGGISLQTTGSSATCSVRQSFSAADAAPLVGKRCTFQAKIQGTTTGGMSYPITPLFNLTSFSNADIPGLGNGHFANIALQQVTAAGIVTQLAYTFDMPALCANGFHIVLSLGTSMNAVSRLVHIGEFDLRETPGAPFGQNNSPPAPEFYDDDIELADGAKWYRRWNAGSAAHTLPASGWFTAINPASAQFRMQISPPMRAAPTMRQSAATILRAFVGAAVGTSAPNAMTPPASALAGPEMIFYTVGWAGAHAPAATAGYSTSWQMIANGWIDASAEF